MVRSAAGLSGGDQEDVVGHRTGMPLGGHVHHTGDELVRHRHAQRGRAAAVQTQRTHTAQLNETHGHLGQRCADGITALTAVNRVENQRAVRTLAYGRARRRAGDQPVTDAAVFHQLIERADHVFHIIPAAVCGADGHAEHFARREGKQCRGVLFTGFQVGGEDVFALRHGGVDRLGQDLIHTQGQRLTDGQPSAHHGADHVHAGLAGGGGVAGVKVAVIEIDAVERVADIVEGCDIKACPAADPGTEGEVRLAQHGAAVGAEADGIVHAQRALQHAVCHHRSQGHAVAHVVVVAVDAGHHTIALGLQLRGHRGDGGQVRRRAAVGDDGRHAAVGRVDDIVFLAQVGLRVAPERAGSQLRALTHGGVGKEQIMPQRLGRRRAQRRGSEHQGEGCGDQFAE